MIGIDPHKASHTAVAIDDKERTLGELRVRSSADQVKQLRSWAAKWPKRTWAVEGAGGLGYLLAQQLVSAGETVLHVPPKLGSRVRLLATGNVNKNDPNDARSVAVAALRSKDLRPVAAEDHAAVLKLWSKRRRDLGSLRTQVVCRLHSVLCDLVPGGAPEEGDNRSSGDPDPGGPGTGGRRRPSSLRPRPRLPGRPAPHRRPDARSQKAPRGGSQGVRHNRN
jgi:transposase